MRRPTTTALAAAALLLAACGTSPDGDAEDAADGTTADQEGQEESADGSDEPEDPAAQEPPEDLPDPNEMVTDGVFRGEGIVLPAPEDWQFDPMALTAQGLVLTSNEEGLQQMAGQAIDVETLPAPLTFDELVDSNREQFEEEPVLDEDVAIDGAAEARQLRYDALPPQQEGLPETSLVLIVADDGEGRLAVFNYAAAAEEFEDAHAEQLVELAGFDPESEPTPPQLPEAELAP